MSGITEQSIMGIISDNVRYILEGMVTSFKNAFVYEVTTDLGQTADKEYVSELINNVEFRLEQHATLEYSIIGYVKYELKPKVKELIDFYVSCAKTRLFDKG